ncbi:hypothetical protein B0T20DRAFT_120418 [Sordaria brevicollis]|uniref:Uncharacterized protein n=1 Tax=Sordaria brevicollis TaxID=83679 RepID=A0AAE0UFN8_SORBR|nr:hypothetical protein B0T20DRAFT_120418 [Sordaria brevicollis]
MDSMDKGDTKDGNVEPFSDSQFKLCTTCDKYRGHISSLTRPVSLGDEARTIYYSQVHHHPWFWLHVAALFHHHHMSKVANISTLDLIQRTSLDCSPSKISSVCYFGDTLSFPISFRTTSSCLEATSWSSQNIERATNPYTLNPVETPGPLRLRVTAASREIESESDDADVLYRATARTLYPAHHIISVCTRLYNRAVHIISARLFRCVDKNKHLTVKRRTY